MFFLMYSSDSFVDSNISFFALFLSKVPISELRNDARDNILGALILAGQYVIPEVCECYGKYFN